MRTAAIPVMAHKLIPVGGSNAIIIPARLIKKLGLTSATEFEIVEVSDGIKDGCLSLFSQETVIEGCVCHTSLCC